MSQTSDRVVAALNGASNSGGDDRRNSWGSGTKLSFSVRLVDLGADVSFDEVIGGMHIEKFVVKGKWNSHVRKDYYELGVLIDKRWGGDKRPYGNFSLDMKALDGDLTMTVSIDVDNFNDTPNRYARSHAESLIRKIMHQLTTG